MSFINRYGYYLSLAALLVFCTGGMLLVSRHNMQSIDAALAQLDHTNTVIAKNQNLSLLAERMLTARQGYAFTHDDELLTRYEADKAAASDLIAELSVLMKDDSAQVSRLNELQHHFLSLSEKLDEMSLLPGANAAGLHRLSLDAQTVASVHDDFMRVSQGIMTVEKDILGLRMQALAAQRTANHAAFYASFAFFIALFSALNAYILYRQSAQEHGEKAATASQEIFRLAAEGASDGIFEWNFAQGKAFYSKQFWTMLGYGEGRFADTFQSFQDLLHPEDKERVLAHIEKYLSGEISEYLIVFRLKHQNGRWVWVNARGRALYDESGKPSRIVGAHTDISHLKAYEDKLRQAKDAAENANRAKTDFLAHMSHEIRTPLTAISGIAEIFESAQAGFDKKQKELVRILGASTSSLKDLVSDILDFSKIESGELELEDKPFGLRDLFDQVTSIVSLRAGEKSLNFSFDYDDLRKQKFLGDRARLRQILLNLAGNAVKFTDQGSVTVTARKVEGEAGAFLRIAVKDTGIGIDPQNFDMIFERFKQADSSVSRRYGGSGLGLAISLRLARLMGGDITVESAAGAGSTFTLLLPFRIEEMQEEHEDDQKTSKALTENIRKQSLNQKNILLVEDYEGNIVILSYLLDSLQCNYDVARTGLEALNMWKEKRYDLILMDVQMPEMDGFTATTQIRRMEQEKDLPRTPVIGMTAHALVGDREKCIESGMDAYLPKPIVELDLKAKIIEFLGQKKAAA